MFHKRRYVRQMGMCGKCSGITGWLFLIFGIIFLLRDFGVWNFWGIGEWSVLFVLIGVIYWGSSKCKDCMAASGMTSKRR